MNYCVTLLAVLFAACGWAFSAAAQVVPNRDSAEYYFQQGASFYVVPGVNIAVMDSGRSHAIAAFSKAIAFDSSYYWAYRNRGYCYQQAGRDELSLADYEQAMQVGRYPGNENLDYLHSRCIILCINMKRWVAAEAHCSAFLAMPGYNSLYYHSAWRHRAEVRIILQQYRAARQDYLVYQRQTLAELLTGENNLLAMQQAITKHNLKQLPKSGRARALARYQEVLAEQAATIDKLRMDSAAVAVRINELEKLIR
jgi:tetratricopeptide (TPR) repeat protein